MFSYEVTADSMIIRDEYGEISSYHGIHFEQYSITPAIAKTFLASLCDHIKNVREAGEMIGVDRRQLQMHDLSKFGLEEFPHYARNFHGDRADPDGFARAWLHHIHYNEHHWQHWIFPDAFTPKDSRVEKGVVEMPETFALEMIADWMGASKTYTGSWDISIWLFNNIPKITIHSRTATFLRATLDRLGYPDVSFMARFFNGA